MPGRVCVTDSDSGQHPAAIAQLSLARLLPGSGRALLRTILTILAAILLPFLAPGILSIVLSMLLALLLALLLTGLLTRSLLTRLLLTRLAPLLVLSPRLVWHGELLLLCCRYRGV